MADRLTRDALVAPSPSTILPELPDPAGERARARRLIRVQAHRFFGGLGSLLGAYILVSNIDRFLDPATPLMDKVRPLIFGLAAPVFGAGLMGMVMLRAGSTVHNDFLYSFDIPLGSIFSKRRLGEIRPEAIRWARIEAYAHFSALRVRSRNGLEAAFNDEENPARYRQALQWLSAHGVEPTHHRIAKVPLLLPLPPDRLSLQRRASPGPLPEPSDGDALAAALELDQALPRRQREAARRRLAVLLLFAFLASLPLAACWYLLVPRTDDFLLGYVLFGSLYGGPVALYIQFLVRQIESDLGPHVVYSRLFPLRFLWDREELGAFGVDEITGAERSTRGGGRPVVVINGPGRQYASFGGFARGDSYEPAMAWCKAQGVEVRFKLVPGI